MGDIRKVFMSGMMAALLFACAACGGAKNDGQSGAGQSAEDGTAQNTGAGSDTAGTDTNIAGDDAVLNIALNADIVSMDVHRTTNDYLVPMNVFDTLFEVVVNSDGSTSIEKSLAEDYSISDDGLTYSITLKDGVVFSDGTPLTANDVKFTFERILTLPESEQTDYAISIEGANELMNGSATELSGIKVEDDTHLTITLAEPFAGFLAQLATPSTSILSKSIVTAAGDDFGVVPQKTLGTGPYIVTSWERGAGLTFEYNPLYWGPEPSVKKVNARIMDASSMDMAFQKGDLDIIDCLMIDSAIVESTYKTKFADNIVSVNRLGINYLMLNEKIEPLGDVKVRKAIQMAINRQAILDSIYSGDGKLEDGIYPEGCLYYSNGNQGWLNYDPDGARELLAQAGYSDGFEMELSLDSGAADSVKNVIQIIAQNLSDVGISANIKNYDHASWLEARNSGDMPSFLAIWILDYNDPDNVIYTFFGSKDNTVVRSDNYADDSAIDRVAAARGIVNTDERAAEYAALEKKLVQDDAVWVPMFSLKHLFVKSDRVEKFVPQWAGWSDIYFKGVTLK
ncbi:ABC transporter substrate-binding protein [Butyrivibrio sp. AE3006]|uniref:ABC transporter substrate-binding protein n=1 Tax=Butyrivibrio sp. AE3006 TaxID=1280673 RepID=UPI00040D672D|nr:ABC transporter substrate-binding protein [Butyrivibrio sp. AE3006]